MNRSYEELISAIEHKCGSLALADIKDNDDGRIDFFNDFFERYSIKKVSTLTAIKTDEVLLAYLIEENRNENFNVLKQRVEALSNLINRLNGRCIQEIGELSLSLSDEILIKIEKFLNSKILKMKFLSKTKQIKELINIFDKGDIAIFLKLLYIDDYAIMELLELVLLVNKINNINYIRFISLISDLSSLNPISQLEEEIIKSFLKEQVNRKAVEESTYVLYEYYNFLVNEQRKETRKNSKKIYSYKELIKLLETKENQEEIKEIDSLLDKISDDDIRTQCLEYIYSHNKKYYDKLEKNYKYKTENSISKYIRSFNEMNIDFNLLSQEEQQQVMKKDIKTINKIIELLKPISLSKKDILEIIKYSELETIEELNQYLEKGYINIDIIKRNIDVYYDKEVLNNLKDNIRFLLAKKVNLMMIDNKEFLLTGSSLITKNITILENVGIDISKLKEFSMLKEMNLQEKINSLVEVGLEEIIKSKPEVLNADKNLAKRIIISRIVGMDIIEDGNINEKIIQKDDFFVRDMDIDKYLFDRDNSNYNTELMIEFNTNINEEGLSYIVEGIVIPKARVTNLCVSLNDIIRPSLYTQEEIKKLEKYKKAEK